MTSWWRRLFSTRTELIPGKVAVIGADSPVGRRLALLLKICPHVRHLVCCPSAPLTCEPNAGNGSCGAAPTVKAVARANATATTCQHDPHRASPLLQLVADLSGIDSISRIECCTETMPHTSAALQGSQLVFVCPGYNFVLARRHRDAVLGQVAGEVEAIAASIAAHARGAVVAIVSEPVNALVPLFAEHLKRASAFDPRKLLGLMAWDVQATRYRVGEVLGMNPFDINVSVVGGHGGVTACPLIHQSGLSLPYGSVDDITLAVQSDTHRLRPFYPDTDANGGMDAWAESMRKSRASSSATATTLERNKHSTHGTSSSSSAPSCRKNASSKGSDDVGAEQQDSNDAGVEGTDKDSASSDAPCLHEQAAAYNSVSYACCEFGVSVLKAMRGDYGITECAFVESTARVEVPYFGSRVVLGREGVERMLSHEPLSHFERELVERAVPAIASDVEAGVQILKRRDSQTAAR